MYRYTLRQSLRDRYGVPERGTVGRDRLNRNINLAVRELWKEAPEILLREEMRIRLDPAITVAVTVDPDDALALRVTDGTILATNGTLRGRWIDLVKSEQVYSRRVRDVFTVKPGAGMPDYSVVIIDEPWENTTDELEARIYTLEYLLPADIAKVLKVIPCQGRFPAGGELVESVFHEELADARVGLGWAATGRPRAYARGNMHRVESPHYTPELDVPVIEGGAGPGLRWGYDSAGVERGAAYPLGRRFGAAGTFSYRECLVWGRSIGINPTQEGVLRPWMISSPSAASEQVTTTWGGTYIRYRSPDVDYVYGYGPNPLLTSYHRSGLEKWIFRARHATEDPTSGTNNAAVKSLENDEAYYLWRVVPAATTETFDRGDDDPVDRKFSLKDFQGHISLRFDRTPTDPDDVILHVIRRPPVMDYDSDPVLVPSECIEALTELIAAYVTGDRDGEPARKTSYYQSFQNALTKLARKIGLSGHDKPSFGDGISVSRDVRMRYGAIKEGL